MFTRKNNLKVRFGIIGTGKIVNTILEAAKLEPRFIANAIYSRSIDRANDFGNQHNIPFRYDSLDKMFSEGTIDAVYIAAPTSLHFTYADMALDYGLHILCEKPLVSNAIQAKILINKAKEQNKMLMEAIRGTSTPNYQVLKSNLDRIGIIRHYFASYCQYSSRYDNFKQGIIENAFKREFSNGATMDIGVYTIYPMIDLFGKPDKIQASGVLLKTGVDGAATVNFSYQNGMTASVMYSKITNSYLQNEIQGENGTILISPIYSFDSIKLIDKQGRTQILGLEHDNSYFYELKEFIDCIEAGKSESNLIKTSTSLITSEVLDEIRKQLGVIFPSDYTQF